MSKVHKYVKPKITIEAANEPGYKIYPSSII